MKKTLSNIARFVFFAGLGVFFIWLFLHKLTGEQKIEILQSFRNANYFWLVVAIVLGVLSHYQRSVRWRMLIEPLGYKPKAGNTFYAVMIGYLANLALPRLGEVSRCTVLARYENVPFNKGFGTVITERAIDILIFLLLFIVNLVLQYNHLYEYINKKIFVPVQEKMSLSFSLGNTLLIIVIAGVVLMLLLYLLLRSKLMNNKIFLKIRHLIDGFFLGLKSLMLIRKPWLFVFHSLSIWGLYLLMAYLVFFCMPESSHLGIDAGLAALVFGSIGIMIVQGGIGIYPVIIAETLVLYGVESTKGYALGWLIWSSQTITIILLGVISLIVLPLINKRKDVKE